MCAFAHSTARPREKARMKRVAYVFCVRPNGAQVRAVRRTGLSRAAASARSRPPAPAAPAIFSCGRWGEELQRRWGQPLVAENRPGGNTIIGGRACAEAPRTATRSASCPRGVELQPVHLPEAALRCREGLCADHKTVLLDLGAGGECQSRREDAGTNSPRSPAPDRRRSPIWPLGAAGAVSWKSSTPSRPPIWCACRSRRG